MQKRELERFMSLPDSVLTQKTAENNGQIKKPARAVTRTNLIFRPHQRVHGFIDLGQNLISATGTICAPEQRTYGSVTPNLIF
jgi:hypothetical protein